MEIFPSALATAEDDEDDTSEFQYYTVDTHHSNNTRPYEDQNLQAVLNK